MDFIHDHPLQPGKHPRRILVTDQQGEAFRRGQQDMWRVGALAAFLGIGGVAGPILDPDGQAHFVDRGGQVAFDVGGKRFQRADIERVQAGVCAVRTFHQARQEPGHGFATPRGRDQQQGRVSGPVQHCLLMRVDGPAATVEPAGNGGGKGRHGPEEWRLRGEGSRGGGLKPTLLCPWWGETHLALPVVG